MRDNFDFLHEDKRQSVPQAGTIAFDCRSQACRKYPKVYNIFAVFQERSNE